MKRIKELQDQLFKTRANYVHLDRCLGLRDGIPFEKWNIYTPDISHNTFENKEAFVTFLERLIADDVFYNSKSIDSIESDIAGLKKQIVDNQDYVKRLEKDLQDAKDLKKGT